MRVKVQFELPLPPIRSWYYIDEDDFKHSKISFLLNSIASDFGIKLENPTIEIDGFPIPMTAVTKKLVRDGDVLKIVESSPNISTPNLLPFQSSTEKSNNELQVSNDRKRKIDEVVPTVEDKLVNEAQKSIKGECSDGSSSSNQSDDSSSSSSTSTSSSDESSSSSEEDVEPAKELPIKHSIRIPSNLTRSKRKAVSNMLSLPASHYHFNADEEFDENEPILNMNGQPFKNPPKVIYSEARLYNPPGTFTKGQKERMAKRNRQESNTEKEKPVAETVHAATRDYKTLSPLVRPAVGQHIAFKTMVLSNLYTPEISNFKEAYVAAIELCEKKRLYLTLELLETSTPLVTVKDTWGPRHKLKGPREGRLEVQLEEGEEGEDEQTNILEEYWDQLIEPKLISNNKQ